MPSQADSQGTLILDLNAFGHLVELTLIMSNRLESLLELRDCSFLERPLVNARRTENTCRKGGRPLGYPLYKP